MLFLLHILIRLLKMYAIIILQYNRILNVIICEYFALLYLNQRQYECYTHNRWDTRDCKWGTVIFQSNTSSKCWQLAHANKHYAGSWPHLGLGSFDCQLVLSPTFEGSGTAVHADMSGSDPQATAKSTGRNTEREKKLLKLFFPCFFCLSHNITTKVIPLL